MLQPAQQSLQARITLAPLPWSREEGSPNPRRLDSFASGLVLRPGAESVA